MNDKPEFSASDLAILREIQKQRREPISGAEIASHVRLSPSGVSEKIKRLRNEGAIVSWSARLHADKVGIQIIAFVGISLQRHDKKTLDSFEAILADMEKFSEVLECYLLTGDYDYLLKVAVPTMIEYKDFIRDKLPSLGMVGKINSMIVLDGIRFSTELPLDHLERAIKHL